MWPLLILCLILAAGQAIAWYGENLIDEAYEEKLGWAGI